MTEHQEIIEEEELKRKCKDVEMEVQRQKLKKRRVCFVPRQGWKRRIGRSYTFFTPRLKE